jgi:DNA polymerase-1
MLVWTKGIKEKQPVKQGRLDMPVPLPEDLKEYEHPNLPEIPEGVAFGFDTETTGLSPHGDDRIVGYSVSIDGGDSFYVAFRHDGDSGNMDEQVALDYLKYLMELPNLKVMANANFDLRFVLAEGITPKPPFFDVLLAERLVNEYRGSYSLGALGELYVGEGKDEDALYEWCHQTYGGRKGRSQAGNIWRAPIKLVEPYARVDAELTLDIYTKQQELIKQADVGAITDLEMRLIEPILHMTAKGIRMDEKKLKTLGDELVVESRTLTKALTQIAGRTVNVNAGRDIQRVFDELGVPYPITDKGNPSFTADFLKSCDAPIAKAISACRKNTKLMSSFIDGAYKKYVVNGRLYAGFNQIGAVTGRSSSSRPNLQQTPRDARFRELFVADEGETMVGIDYSQIEPRLALHYCAGEVANELKELFKKKPESDFYAILMTSAPDVERQVMKMVLLAQLYGQGEASLSLKLGDAITGKRILDGFNGKFPFFRELAKQVSSTARRRKYIRTVGQRRCNYNGADSTTLHKAPNRLIQGGAADIMKKAIVDLWEAGWCADDKLGAPIAVVHDELIFTTKLVGDDLKEALNALESVLVSAYELTCPLHAESNTGKSWWDIH